MRDKVFFDTSFIVAAFFRDVEGWEKAKEVIKKAFLGEIDAYISIQVLTELFHVLKYKKKIDFETCYEIVEAIKLSNNWKILRYDEKTVNRAMDIVKRYNILFWDALIIATMLENGIRKIYTFDGEFKKVKEIEVLEL